MYRPFIFLFCVLMSLLQAGTAGASESDIRIVLAWPTAVPAGAAVKGLQLHAVDAHGRIDADYSATVQISGLLVRPTGAPVNSRYESFTANATFDSGKLQVTPESLSVRQLTIASDGLTVTSDGAAVSLPVSRRPAWTRLLPPVIAIALAIVLKDIWVSLILATLSGCLLFYPLNDWHTGIPDFCETMVQQVADHDHASVILFTVLLGAMIRLMNDSGGSRAAIDQLAKFAHTRRRGMVLTWLMGLLVFFDDYANTMLIGGAMRPLSDRLRISRAKLAFLLDSTAAPIAGLAISTWTAFEIQQVEAGFGAAGIDADVAPFFWSTIPYRIYPLLMIGVVAAVAVSGRDFGAMLQAERSAKIPEADCAEVSKSTSIWLSAIPVGTLILIAVVGFVQDTDPYQLLLVASFVASTLAFLLSVASRQLTVEQASRSWVDGIGSMIPPVTVLVLAWAVSSVCQSDRLDTAGYIIDLLGDSVRAEFLPAAAFLTAGAIAFAIGSSFTTMALLVPMLIPLAWSLLGATGVATTGDAVFLATTGAILAGAIFGDHCSPISDTTVLSSAAAGCDHFQHVATQLPYALLTAIVSVLMGYLPIGFGIPWWICLPMATVVSIGGIVFLGRDSEQSES